VQQRLSREFFEQVKNNAFNKWTAILTTSAWGKLLAFETKKTLDKMTEECGPIQSIETKCRYPGL